MKQTQKEDEAFKRGYSERDWANLRPHLRVPTFALLEQQAKHKKMGMKKTKKIVADHLYHFPRAGQRSVWRCFFYFVLLLVVFSWPSSLVFYLPSLQQTGKMLSLLLHPSSARLTLREINIQNSSGSLSSYFSSLTSSTVLHNSSYYVPLWGSKKAHSYSGSVVLCGERSLFLPSSCNWTHLATLRDFNGLRKLLVKNGSVRKACLGSRRCEGDKEGLEICFQAHLSLGCIWTEVLKKGCNADGRARDVEEEDAGNRRKRRRLKRR